MHTEIADVLEGRREWCVVCDDAANVLPLLTGGGMAAIVTDPPYAQANEAYDSDVACCPDVWCQCYRVAQPDAALLSFAGNPTYHRIASAIEAAGWKVRQMWGWVYADGMITSGYPREGWDSLAPAFSPICFATKGKVLLQLEKDGKKWKCFGERTGRNLSDNARRSPRLSSEGKWPRTILADDDVPGFEAFVLHRGAGKNEGGKGHPNRKPLALMLWLIGKLPPGGVILDPFCGSGSTGVACLQAGRRFVGIEMSEGYATLARQRLEVAERDEKGKLFPAKPTPAPELFTEKD